MTENKGLPVVLLDIDDTILNFHMAEYTAIKKTFTSLGIDASDEVIQRYSRINQQHWERLERKEITREQVLLGRFETLFKELGIEADAHETQEMYERLLAIGHFFMPGAEELLKELDGRYRLFICSNGTAAVQAGRIASAQIADFFENIFISERIGHDKPSREYFDACFALIPQLDKERAIILGDSLSSDILGGINAGIKTCWFNPKGKKGREDIRPDFEISALEQFPKLLEELFGKNT